MYNDFSSPTVTNCTFIGNTSFSDGGGMLNSLFSSPTVTNTAFCDNTPDHIWGNWVDDGGNTFCPLCDGDVNGDGTVNVLDLIDLLLCFGQPDTPPCDTGQDVNGDGVTNVLDLIDLLLVFGQACP